MTSDPFWARAGRDVVRVGGPDAVSFLQGQLSQDVAGLAVGASAWSFVLQPQGKVDAWFRVTRTAADELVLDVDGGWGDGLVARINRFKLRVAADVERLDWHCIAIRHVAADPAPFATAGVLALPVSWAGRTGVDLLGPSVVAPPGVREATAAELEAWRVDAGMPAMGAELDESTIPAEAGVVDVSVSFTKGCYTGQELVARVDSRGANTPRKLRRVELAQVGAARPGDELHLPEAGERAVGVLTSVAGAVALAYVRREVEPPADAVVSTGAGPIAARVLPLPAH